MQYVKIYPILSLLKIQTYSRIPMQSNVMDLVIDSKYFHIDLYMY